MKALAATLTAASIILISGCDTGTPGGPAVDRTTTPMNDREITTPTPAETETRPETDTSVLQETSRAIVGPSDGTFTLDVPNLATTLKQGESKATSIEINRGDNMNQDVTLEFANVPPGVTVEPAQPVIKNGETEADVMITASADAAVGDYTIRVNGSPATGADATNEFKISIEAM